MKIFIDTANLKEIKEALSLGIIDGVTTNPTLIAKEGKPRDQLIKEICEITRKPVSAEVLAVEEEEMFQEALILSKIHDCVVVKIPLIGEGLKVVKRLKVEKIPTNVTLCFSPLQALMAAKAGATYVSVFMGRLDDVGHRGAEVALDCHELITQYGFETEVLAASVRHPQHILETSEGGIPVSTAPYKVLKQLLNHPLTKTGLEQFLKDGGRG